MHTQYKDSNYLCRFNRRVGQTDKVNISLNPWIIFFSIFFFCSGAFSHMAWSSANGDFRPQLLSQQSPGDSYSIERLSGVVLSHSTRKETSLSPKIFNYLFILSSIKTFDNSLPSVSKLHSCSFTKRKKSGGSSGAETEMESIYAAPLTVMSKGSILHLTCHIVVMFCVFVRMLAAILSQPEPKTISSVFQWYWHTHIKKKYILSYSSYFAVKSYCL